MALGVWGLRVVQYMDVVSHPPRVRHCIGGGWCDIRIVQKGWGFLMTDKRCLELKAIIAHCTTADQIRAVLIKFRLSPKKGKL